MENRATTINEQAQQVLEMAEAKGVATSLLFKTTFKRYQVQLSILNNLEKAIKDNGTTITKEYVKGRLNLCVNPAITEYNKTATAANNTVATLTKIVQASSDMKSGAGSLSDAISSMMADE